MSDQTATDTAFRTQDASSSQQDELHARAATPAVEAIGVHKAFGRLHVLKGIDMTVMPGTVTVILGPSGSGKSTFLRLINQLETLTGGEIRVDGEMIGFKKVEHKGQEVLQMLNDKEIAAQRSKLGMVFQRFNLFPHMTALENVMEAPVHVKHMGKSEARELAVAELQRVGLGQRLDYYPSQLSGGQQQRVAIARAIVTRPSLILADEPTGNLDSKTTVEIMDIFHELHDAGNTIVLITHDDDVARQASRIVRIKDGQLTEVGA